MFFCLSNSFLFTCSLYGERHAPNTQVLHGLQPGCLLQDYTNMFDVQTKA